MCDSVRVMRVNWKKERDREEAESKQKAYDELYERLDTKEREKDMYLPVTQKDLDGKDVQQAWVIKDRNGNVLTSKESILRGWKEYFKELINEENEKGRKVEEVETVEQEFGKIGEYEVRKAQRRVTNGKAVGPDGVMVEVWKCLREKAVEFLMKPSNTILTVRDCLKNGGEVYW